MIRYSKNASNARGLAVPRQCLVLAALVLTHATVFAADRADALTVFAGYTAQRDSNLFRLPDGQVPVIDGQSRDRSDTRQAGEIGFEFDRSWGKQRLRADASATRTYYSDFDFLDFPASNYDVKWDWGAGKRWLGAFNALQVESQRSFADFSLPTRSVNTYRSYSAEANFRLLTHWTIGAGVATVSSEYNDLLSVTQEYDEDAVDLRVTYRAASGNELALVARSAKGEYPNRTDVLIVDKRFDQDDIRLDGRYSLTARSLLTGYIGLAERTYQRTPSRDYSGPIGRLAYDWAPSQRLTVRLQMRRELGAQEDLTDTFVVTTAGGITVSWKHSEKVSSELSGELLNRDYQGDPGFGLSPTDGRKDEQIAYGAKLIYAAARWLDCSLAYEKEARRRGGDDVGQFENDAFLLKAQVSF